MIVPGGTILPVRNSHGNTEYLAQPTSNPFNEVQFLTQGAAEWWLEIVEEVAKCRWQRGVK